MSDERRDLLELFDYVWARFSARMAGLTDDEYRWLPTVDDRIGLRWRLAHIAELLGADRNGVWLGHQSGTAPDAADTAAQALAQAAAAYVQWRGQLAATDLTAAVGPVAGEYAESTRRSFAYHIVDELTHHCAEAALLRDLYRLRAS